MELCHLQNLRAERSDCPNFGTNGPSCSQSRKVSVGIVVDSVLTSRPISTTEVQVAAPVKENAIPGDVFPYERKTSGPKPKAACTVTEAPALENAQSPWISTRSLSPTSMSVHHAKQTSHALVSDNGQNKIGRTRKVQPSYSAQFVPNLVSVLQSVEGNEKKFAKVSYKRENQKDFAAVRVEEMPFATPYGVPMLNTRDVENEKNGAGNRSSETLKLKLWEILGTVSSPNKQLLNSQVPKAGANNLSPGKNCDKMGDKDVEPRWNSDTIEADSESPHDPIQRPVTRSLTQKRAPVNVKPNRTKNRPSSSNKQKDADKNAFFFEEGWSRRLHDAVCGASSVPKMRKNKQKSNKVEPRKIDFSDKEASDIVGKATARSKTPIPVEKISSLGSRMEGIHQCFPQNDNKYNEMRKNETSSDKIGPPKIYFPDKDTSGDSQEINNLNKASLSPEKTSSFGSKMGGAKRCSPKGNKKYLEPEVGIEEEDFHQSTVAKTSNNLEGFNNLSVPRNANREENICNLSFHNILHLQDSLHSPTFGLKTTMEFFSPSSPAKTNKTEMLSPALSEKEFVLGDINNFKTWQTSKANCNASNLLTESSDDEAENICSPTRNLESSLKDINAGLSKSSSEERGFESAEDMSDGQFDCSRERGVFSPETVIAEKTNFILRPTKRLRSDRGIKLDEFSPVSPFLKGTEETNGFQEAPEQSQEDGLSRAVSLIALALKRLEGKLGSVTRNKSSEILTSIAEEMNSKLKSVESQILTDLGKITSATKLKRKRLEAKFQEQQERLELVQAKFKEEVDRNLEDCGSMLEGLEANWLEFKGTIERQKASHRKLLIELEQAMGMQLSDGERRITAIHKLAGEKMLQLKHGIAACLQGDFFG